MEYLPHDALEIAKLASKDIRELQDVLAWIAIPLALIPPVPRSWRWIVLRTLVITVAVWYLSYHYNIVFAVPWRSMVLDMQDPENIYDGVGGNVALLFFGWVPPLVECLGVLIVCRYLFSVLAFLSRRVTGSHNGQAGRQETPAA